MFQIFKKKKDLTLNTKSKVKEINVAKNKWRFVLWGILVIIAGVITWLAVTGVVTFKKITSLNSGDIASFFKHNGNISPSDVKTEGDSRINILLAGIGGPGHDGPDLTDTLQVLSIDPVNNTAAMVSVPRDLYVKQANGEWTKVNAVNALAAQNYCKVNSCASGVDKGGAAMKTILSNILGIDITNFIRIDFNGFKQMVDAVGGIDVTVPTTLSDPFYPCPDPSTSYCPLYIKAGRQHFDGAAALKYARSRETTNDFDRSKRQQLVLEAVVTKAKTLGILADPTKVNNLLAALGSNVKTDLSSSDMVTLLNLQSKIDQTKITVTTLDTSADGPLTQKTDPTAGYIIYPRLGLGNYTDVKSYVAKALLDPYIVKEQARVTLINATGNKTQTEKIKTLLTGLGYDVVSATDAPSVQVSNTISKSSSKPFTESLLKQRFLASEVSQNSSDSSDLTLTVGSIYLTK